VLPDAKIIATLVAELCARAAAVSMAGPHAVREACSAHVFGDSGFGGFGAASIHANASVPFMVLGQLF
jgi:hypothetical protein